MAASFPGTLWTWTDQVDNTSTMDAADVNSPAAEIIAIESHLGAGDVVAGQIILNSAAGVDTWISLQTNSVEKWRIGSDESDSEKFKIHTGALADPSLFEMGLTGHIELTNVAETASDPGRHLYLQRVHTSALGSGKGLTGIEVRSTFNGDADALSSEVKGGEFKARHTTGNTYDVGTFKGVIGNVDCKNGTVTTGWAVEGAIDVSSGGTFTTVACFHGNLNNSGTVTNSYGVYVHGLSGNVLTRGLYVDYATTGIYLDNCTTDIRLHNGATLVNAADDGGTLTITEDNIVLIGGGWGKIAFGGYTDWGTGATGTDITGNGWDWVTSTVGHLDSGTLATAVAAAYHAMTVTVSQTTSTSVFGTWTELYFKNSVDLGGSNNYASVWGQMEGGTNVTSPDTGMFMTAFYGNVKMGSTLTIAAGVAVNGFRAQAEISAVTNNGRLAAFECLKSGGADWEYGLYIADAATGINVGACATTAINVAANVVMPQFLTIGTTADPIHWDGVAENILIYTECTDTTTSSKTANKFVLDAAHSAATTSGRLECFRGEVRSYATNDISAGIRAVVGQVSFMGNCTYVGAGPQGCFGVVASVWSGSNLTANGDVFGLGVFMGVETSSTYNNESAMIYCYQYGKTSVESLIRLDCNIGATSQMSYFIDGDGLDLASHHDFFSTDTIDTAADTESDGTIKIRLSNTVYEIPIYLA